MYIYTHFVVAGQVEAALQPQSREQYYLGAIVPDFRYLAGMPRDHTHRPLPEIAAWLPRYPHLRSFILGYLVHCALDELEVRPLVFRRYPLRPVRRLMRLKLAHTLLETHYIENAQVTAVLPETGNELLDELGIPRQLVRRSAQWINSFLRAPSFEAEIDFLKDALLSSGNPRFKRYLGPLLALQRSRLLKELLWKSFDPVFFQATMASYLLSGQDVAGRWVRFAAGSESAGPMP